MNFITAPNTQLNKLKIITSYVNDKKKCQDKLLLNKRF